MSTGKIVLYVFIALLFCSALVHDFNVGNDGIEIENNDVYENYKVNSLYLHGNTIYYNVDINKIPIELN